MSAPFEIIEAVRRMIEAIAGAAPRPVHVGENTRLVDDYWLDSVDLFKLVLACETEFQIVFDQDADFDPRTFETVGTLANAIQMKLIAQRAVL